MFVPINILAGESGVRYCACPWQPIRHLCLWLPHAVTFWEKEKLGHNISAIVPSEMSVHMDDIIMATQIQSYAAQQKAK
eukprot:1157495-Pelagomonas_calceolata.AAC.4